MRAASGKPSVVEHEDPVRVLNGRRPLRDDQHGRTVGQLPECFAECRVRCKVQSRCAVVEDQELRLADECSGDRQTLPLTAGEVLSVFGVHLVEPVCFRCDHIECLRGFQRILQVMFRGICLAPEQVLPDRPVKEHGLLRDNADAAAECLVRKFRDRNAVHGDRARSRLVKARDQVDER